MFEVIQIANGRAVRFNLHALPLRDGTMAHTLDGGQLFRALAKIRVPGISATTGHQALLVAYAKHLKETTPDPLSGKIPAAEKAAP